MEEELIEEAFEIYSEFAKHLLYILKMYLTSKN